MRTLVTRQPVKVPFTEPFVVARTVTFLRCDAASAAASAWLIGGLYLDGWAHHRLASLEMFFTPWQAVLYSGCVARAAMLISVLLRHASVQLPGFSPRFRPATGHHCLGSGSFPSVGWRYALA